MIEPLLALAGLTGEPRFGVGLGSTPLGPAYGVGVEGLAAPLVGRLAIDERAYDLEDGGRRQAWSFRGSVAYRLAWGPAWLDLGAGWRGRGLVDVHTDTTTRMNLTSLTVPNGPEAALAVGLTAWRTTWGPQALALGLEAEAGYAPFLFAGGTAERWSALGVFELGRGRLRAGWQHDLVGAAFDGPVLSLDFR
jgi:hypothetical protein